jgi:hypothetical protein
MSLIATATSVFVLSVGYWSGFALFDSAGVLLRAQSALYVCCVLALLYLRRSTWSAAPAKSWLVRAAYSVLLALLFYGANRAQDILYGPERLKSNLPGWLGGLELWWILCPGIASIALAAASARLLSERR